MNFFAPEQLAQTINPWTWLFKSGDNTNGLINVTNYKAGNPQLEHTIIHEVAGYGMQLNIIENLLTVFLETMPERKFTAQQKEVIMAFRTMMKEITEKKERLAVEQLSSGGVEGLISNLKCLKEKHPEEYKKVAEKIKAAL